MISRKTLQSTFILVTILFWFNQTFAQSVNFDWVKATEKISSYEFAFNEVGDIYTVGLFYDTVAFAPGDTLISVGSADIFVQKQDVNGNFIWAKSIGGVGLDLARNIEIDSVGNLIIGGGFNNTVDFNTGSGIYNLTAPNVIHAFLLKLDENGNFIWAKKFDALQNGLQINDFELSNSGNLYVTGYFSFTVDFDLGPNTYSLTTNGTADWYIAKYNLEGDLVWANSYPSPGTDKGIALAIDSNENIVNVGFIGNQEVIKKIDSSGAQIWHEELYGWYLEFNDVNTDEENNIIVGGRIHGNADMDPDTSSVFMINAINPDAFAIKLNSNGDFIWAFSIGSGSTDQFFIIEPDSAGNIYLIGTFQGTVDFNSGPAVNQISSIINSADLFFLKVDSLANFQYVKTIQGPQSQYPNDFHLNSIGEVFLLGSFSGLTDFDPSPALYSLTTPTNVGASFVEKFSNCSPQFGTDNVVGCDSITWLDGITYTSDTVSPIYTLLSADDFGCDSIVTLNLTLNNSSHWTDSFAVCEPYTWLDGNTYTSSTNTPTYTLTNAVGCDSIIHLDLSYNGTYVYAFISNAITVKAFPSGGQYQWLDCNNGYEPIPGATAVTFVADQNGSYAALVILNGCTDTTNCLTIGEIGLAENAQVSEIEVFPNPTNGEVTVSFDKLQGEVKISLFNILGEELYIKEYTLYKSNDFTITGDVGTYFLKIENENELIKVYRVEKL